MPVRKIERTKTFAHNLENLSKKYVELGSAVDAALNRYAATGESTTSFRLMRVKGLPVFKDRLAFGNVHRYCDGEDEGARCGFSGAPPNRGAPPPPSMPPS